jgi:hypothetical protein
MTSAAKQNQTGRVLNLFTLELCIEDKTGIGEHVVGVRVLLLYAACIRLVHVWVADVVIGAIWLAVGIFISEVRRRRMGQVVVNCGATHPRSGKGYVHIRRRQSV